MIRINNGSAYLITKPEHVLYLSGFDGEGFLILTRNSKFLATDQRYWLRAKGKIKKTFRLFGLKTGWEKELNKTLNKFKTVCFEEDHLTVSGLRKWKKILPKRKWKESLQVFKKMRLVKTDKELFKMKKAAAFGDVILKKIKGKLKPGITESFIASSIICLAHELADGVSFDPIVAFGKNAAIPHHLHGKTRLKKDDAILIDMGVKYMNYMSDMTRCFFVGKGIAKVRQMHELLLKVQKTAVQMVRPGIKVKDLILAVRGLLGKEAKYFTHGLGHGVGLKIHEGPSLSEKSDDVLDAGMVITIEPGIYKPGIGGVRIEDMVVVKEKGGEVITKSGKKTFLR